MLTEATRKRLLEAYRDGPRVIAETVASLSATDLDRHRDAGWTAREVIHHLADSEVIEAARLRRILAEDNPTLHWVDEEEDARRLHYDRPVETSVALVEAIVASNALLAEGLSPEEWIRAGTHSRAGSYAVEDWLQKMSQHAHDHAGQILRAAGRDVI